MNNFLVLDRQKRTFIVTGPPGAGKTTWVKERRTRGDLVVDLDAILAALSLSDTTHEDASDVLEPGIDVKEHLVRQIGAGAYTFNHAYIITTRGARRIKEITGGQIVKLDCDPHEAEERIRRDATISEEIKKTRIEKIKNYFSGVQERRKPESR